MLGPLLFLINVNSLADHLSCSWFAFADDFKLYVSQPKSTSVVTAISPLQQDLDNLSSVSESWNLKLNPTKCVVLRFGGRKTENSSSGYWLYGTELRRVDSHRDLGIQVDYSLKFHSHISTIVNKASALANQILRCTVNSSVGFMVTLFTSHIRPLLDYCSTVWNLGYIGDVRKLESVQRRWTKEVDGCSELSYAERIRLLNLFSIWGRMLRTDLIKMWKIFNSVVDVGLLSILERQSHTATRGHRYKISVLLCRSEVRRRFFNVRSVGIWNNLPAAVVQSDSVSQFKRMLDETLGTKLYRTIDQPV